MNVDLVYSALESPELGNEIGEVDDLNTVANRDKVVSDGGEAVAV